MDQLTANFSDSSNGDGEPIKSDDVLVAEFKRRLEDAKFLRIGSEGVLPPACLDFRLPAPWHGIGNYVSIVSIVSPPSAFLLHQRVELFLSVIAERHADIGALGAMAGSLQLRHLTTQRPTERILGEELLTGVLRPRPVAAIQLLDIDTLLDAVLAPFAQERTHRFGGILQFAYRLLRRCR